MHETFIEMPLSQDTSSAPKNPWLHVWGLIQWEVGEEEQLAVLNMLDL